MKQDELAIFSDMEKDAIGEVLNISIGSSATAVSNMLQKRTDITTPRVEVVSPDDFEITSMEPAIGVEIAYIQGLTGKNIFVLKRTDVKAIVESLMQMEISDEEFQMDELNTSAVCEVMNQMMGAASTALATLLGEPVDISPPTAYEVDTVDDIKSRYFTDDSPVVVVRFNLTIENILDSEFLSVMPTDFAKKVVSMLTEEEPEAPVEHKQIASAAKVSQAPIPQPMTAPAPQPAQAPTAQQPVAQMPQQHIPQSQQQMSAQQIPQQMAQQQIPVQQMPQQQIPVQQMPQQMQQQMPPQQMGYDPSQQMYQQPMGQQMYGQPMPQQMYGQPMYQQPAPSPRMIQVQTAPSDTFEDTTGLSGDQGRNLDMLMSVPLEISVEIGRSRKPIKEIIAFQQGTLVVLDKLAGEQVDLYVNNQCIAKGDVVVVDDSFGVRITKILDKHDIFNIK